MTDTIDTQYTSSIDALSPYLNLLDRASSSQCGIPVPLSVDGRRYFAGLDLDHDERSRRNGMGLTAITSTGLLHALWDLPLGVPFPCRVFSNLDVRTFDLEGRGCVTKYHDFITRVYQPIGTIRWVAVADNSLCRAVEKAASHPPSVRRIAIWRTPNLARMRFSRKTLFQAQLYGVEVIAFDGDNSRVVIASRSALRAVPTVFRWWQAELAYRNLTSRRVPTE